MLFWFTEFSTIKTANKFKVFAAGGWDWGLGEGTKYSYILLKICALKNQRKYDKIFHFKKKQNAKYSRANMPQSRQHLHINVSMKLYQGI